MELSRQTGIRPATIVQAPGKFVGDLADDRGRAVGRGVIEQDHLVHDQGGRTKREPQHPVLVPGGH